MAHYDYANLCSVTYYNAVNYCPVSHDNYANDCNIHSNYTNHFNYTHPDDGAAKTPTWSALWSGNTLLSDYIEGSVEAIKEIRNNIAYLESNKAKHNAGALGPLPDSALNDNIANTVEKPDNSQYETLWNNIKILWDALKATGNSNLGTQSSVNRGEDSLIQKTDIESLKRDVDSIAGSCYQAYTNHANYTAAEHTNYAQYVNWIASGYFNV